MVLHSLEPKYDWYGCGGDDGNLRDDGVDETRGGHIVAQVQEVQLLQVPPVLQRNGLVGATNAHDIVGIACTKERVFN